MRVDLERGALEGVRQCPSSNFDARPAAAVIDLVVVHGISLPPGEFGGAWIDALFTNTLDPGAHAYFQEICSLKVSAHLLIARTGEITQYVPFHQRAWHAGQSSFAGRTACNDFSVGIELEGTDDTPYAGIQYRALARVIRALMQAYPAIGPERIVGHSDIAPGRKTDPGPAFEWARLHTLLRNELGA